MKALYSVIGAFTLLLGLTSPVFAETATLFPDSAGNETNITHVTGAVFHWDAVNESTADDASSFVEQNGDGSTARDLYNITNSTTTGDISNVRIYIRGLGTSAWYKHVLKTNSTVYTSAEFDSASFTTQYTDYSVNPNTSSAWTWTQIDALQIGTQIYRDPSQAPNVTQIYALITYTPPEPTLPTAEDLFGTSTATTTPTLGDVAVGLGNAVFWDTA